MKDETIRFKGGGEIGSVTPQNEVIGSVKSQNKAIGRKPAYTLLQHIQKDHEENVVLTTNLRGDIITKE